LFILIEPEKPFPTTMKNKNQEVMRKKLITSAAVSLAAVSIILCSEAVHAQEVVNYEAPGSYGATAYSGQGAASDPGNNFWNVIPASGGTTAFDEDSIGNSTSVTLSLSSYQTYNNGAQGAQGTPGGLLAPFILENNGTPVTGTFNNVAAGTYDLYLYGYNYPDGDRGTTFTASIGATSYGTLSTIGLNANAVGGTTAENAFTAGADYVEFTGLTLASIGQIQFTFAANAAINRPNGLGDYSGVNGEGDFNGVQLVSVVPEPSAYAFIALGSVFLLGFHMWKRGQATV
jgi:hypothetical protein